MDEHNGGITPQELLHNPGNAIISKSYKPITPIEGAVREDNPLSKKINYALEKLGKRIRGKATTYFGDIDKTYIFHRDIKQGVFAIDCNSGETIFLGIKKEEVADKLYELICGQLPPSPLHDSNSLVNIVFENPEKLVGKCCFPAHPLYKK